MKNVRFLEAVFAVAFLFTMSCGMIPPVARPTGSPSVSSPMPSPSTPSASMPYAGRKATIAMDSVEGLNLVSVGWGGAGVGPSINEVFSDALMATGKFRVVNRAQLKTILREQDLSSSGRISPSTAVKPGEITGAALLMVPKIVSFDPGYESANAALGAVAGLSSNPWIRLGGILLGGVRKSKISIVVQIADTRTSENIFSQPFEVETTDWGLGGGAGIGGLRGGVSGGGNLWYGTAMGTALQAVVKEAVASVAANVTPERFPDHFKY